VSVQLRHCRCAPRSDCRRIPGASDGSRFTIATEQARGTPTVTVAPLPRIRDVLARTAGSLTVACVIPAALIYLTLVAFNLATAVLVALAWTCGVIGWRWATQRRPSALLFLTVTIMAVRTGFTLATGNSYVYFIQPVFADALVAIIFLASLLSTRPVVARLAADFYPMAKTLASRPGIRRLFWRITLMWGLVILGKGSITLYLLQSQSVVDFVLLKGVAIVGLTSLAAGVTIWMSAVVVRREHLAAG